MLVGLVVGAAVGDVVGAVEGALVGAVVHGGSWHGRDSCNGHWTESKSACFVLPLRCCAPLPHCTLHADHGCHADQHTLLQFLVAQDLYLLLSPRHW